MEFIKIIKFVKKDFIFDCINLVVSKHLSLNKYSNKREAFIIVMSIVSGLYQSRTLRVIHIYPVAF